MKKLVLKRGETAEVMEVTIRAGIIIGLMVWAFFIIAPFIKPILWGAILAAALYPVFSKVCGKAGGRRKLVGSAFVLGAIMLLIVPAVMLVGGAVEGIHTLAEEWHAGVLKVPEPQAGVKEWPVAGGWLYDAWMDAAHNPAHLLRKIMPHVSPYGVKLFGMVEGAGADLIGFTVSLILAGIQLSPVIVLGPIAIYAFSTHGGMPAVLFAILCVLVSTIDNFIRPVLMGRNVDTPMVVVIVGALGGLMLSGVMGLFLGAVVVALCYQIFMAWLSEDGPERPPGREPWPQGSGAGGAHEKSSATGS